MIGWVHVGETAFLMALAYALGCAIGFFTYRLSHRAAARPAVVEPDALDLAARIAARLPETPAAPAEPPQSAPVAAEPVETPAIALIRLPPEPLPVAEPAKIPPRPQAGRPKTLVKPRGGVSDDLKAIKGIGPKLEPKLNALGIFHLAQIAGWSRANADWISSELGFPGRVERESWVAQAKALTPKTKAKTKKS